MLSCRLRFCLRSSEHTLVSIHLGVVVQDKPPEHSPLCILFKCRLKKKIKNTGPYFLTVPRTAELHARVIFEVNPDKTTILPEGPLDRIKKIDCKKFQSYATRVRFVS